MASSTIPDGPSQQPTNAVMDNGYSYGSFPKLQQQSAHDVETAGSSTAAGQGTVVRPAAGDVPKTSVRVLAPDLVRGLLMALMAMDHSAVSTGIWSHGTSLHQEQDSLPVTKWNSPTAYVVRSFTHLCMGGFTFLLGMGVVYLARSRRRMGWSAARLVRYFAVRMGVLTGVTVVFGWLLSGFQVLFFNIALFSLAVNYFLAGVLWLLVEQSEGLLARAITTLLPTRDEDSQSSQPLLQSASAPRPGKHAAEKASSVSWHVHNVILLVLSLVTIFWNIWLSPTHGHCVATTSDALGFAAVDSPTITNMPKLPFPPISLGDFLREVWFRPISARNAVSNSPPLVWLSFAILGLLYGRIMTRRRWGIRAQTAGHVLAGVLLFLLFVSTRLFHFGNLSEGCLQTPAHKAHPDTNPYLVDAPSFFYIIKYPPSVAYYGLTMSFIFFLLAIFTEIPPSFATRRLTVLLDFGTAALFFYVAHLLLITLLAIPLLLLFGVDGTLDPIAMGPNKHITQMWLYWLFWLLIVLILWPVCKWYSRFKSRKGPDSLWRLF